MLQQDPKESTTTSGVVNELEPPIEVQRCEFGFDKVDVMNN